jgi:hypothetical protein
MTAARSGARNMSAVHARRILVIANRTSSTPALQHLGLPVTVITGGGGKFQR